MCTHIYTNTYTQNFSAKNKNLLVETFNKICDQLLTDHKAKQAGTLVTILNKIYSLYRISLKSLNKQIAVATTTNLWVSKFPQLYYFKCSIFKKNLRCTENRNVWLIYRKKIIKNYPGGNMGNGSLRQRL